MSSQVALSVKSPLVAPRKKLETQTVYSRKVFVGAVPSGTSELNIRRSMEIFGEVEITWPDKGLSIYPAQRKLLNSNCIFFI